MEKPLEWWELLDDTAAYIRFNYEEIMKYGSEELKNAANIVLGGHLPAIHTKGGGKGGQEIQ